MRVTYTGELRKIRGGNGGVSQKTPTKVWTKREWPSRRVSQSVISEKEDKKEPLSLESNNESPRQKGRGVEISGERKRKGKNQRARK